MKDPNVDKENFVEFDAPHYNTGLQLSKPKTTAAGISAVISSFQHISKEIGLLDGFRLLMKMNQKKGFDCPGCAWPDPDNHRSSIAEYCENGAKAIAEEATKKRIDARFFSQNSVVHLSRQTDYWLGKAGRLTEPMYLPENGTHYQAISWQEAFGKIANKLKSLEDVDQAVFYTSGRTSNEAAFLYQLFVRLLGTNNLPDCSNMCHESSGTALNKTVGIGKGSVTLDDFHHAELILVIGQNPGTNHPRMLSALEACKKNKGTVVSINPLAEAGLIRFTNPQKPMAVLKGGTALADLFVQVKINGDVALLKGIMRLMYDIEQSKGGVFDKHFIEKYTSGFDAFVEDLKKVSVEECVEKSGISLEMMQQLAALCAQKKRIIICWAMGLTQHKNGVENIQEIVNLLLLRGSIGIKGGGTCPVRGHSNVQGDRTMGIYEKPSAQFIDRLSTHFSFQAPTAHGYDTVDAIRAMRKGKVKVFMAMGGNFLSATPDTAATAEGLQNCELTIQISTKLNRSHLITGKEALILPCLGRTELDQQAKGVQFITVENSMGIVHRSKGTLPPASDYLLSEIAIVCQLGKATFADRYPQIDWQAMQDNYDLIRAHIEAVIPGFEDFNKRIKASDFGFYLPNGARERDFKTSTGKANFTVNPMPDNRVDKDCFVMMTIRTHDQYNTTIYGLDDRYRGIYNERRVVLMNKDDMEAQGLKNRDVVDLTSHFEDEVRVAKTFFIVPYDIPKGCVATYFPETNSLVPLESVAKESNTPTSKYVIVKIVKKEI